MNLLGARVIITRPRDQADSFALELQQHGAVPIFFPVIEIGRLEDATSLDAALSRLADFNWLVVTSVNGVEAVWERLAALGISALPAGLKIAAIGPKTESALKSRGVTPDFVPAEYVAEAILPGLGDVRGQSILLTRADIARPALADAIRLAGGKAYEVTAYRTLPATPDAAGMQALAAGVQVITFTSSSTVRNFLAIVQAHGLDPLNLPGQPLIACIGPITAATAREEGVPVHLVAKEYTTQGLLQTLVNA